MCETVPDFSSYFPTTGVGRCGQVWAGVPVLVIVGQTGVCG